MNKHIIMVMKWKQDKKSVTQQELEDNRDAAYRAYYDVAYRAYCAPTAAANAAYYAYVAANNAYNASIASIASTAYVSYIEETEKYLTKYFDNTGEDRQNYITAIK